MTALISAGLILAAAVVFIAAVNATAREERRESDCPWCSPSWDFRSGVTAADCTCTKDCKALCCRMLPVSREETGA